MKTWKEHLAAMDHSKGTSSVMIQTAMKAEIKELRMAVTAHRNYAKKQSQIISKWRLTAGRYRAELIKARRA
jgi:hypothetical protein